MDNAGLGRSVVTVGLIIFELQFSPNSINASDCITFKVGQGKVFEPVIATGTVEAENEVLVLCPTTSIKRESASQINPQPEH